MKRVSMLLVALVVVVACGAHVAPAQTTKSGPEVHKLTVRAAAPSGRLLQYRLVPPIEQFTAGNAAPVYMAAMLVLANQPPEWHEKVDRLQAMPMDQLPRDEVRALLKEAAPRGVSRGANPHGMLAQLHVAARRDTCDWDLPRREHGAMTLLPHLHRMRPFMRLLSLDTRLAILDGRYDDAADSMQTSLAMARHCQAGDGVLLDGLVAAMVSQILLDDVAAFIGHDGAPNLYWPLANIPRPMMDTPQIIRRERGFFYYVFPALRDPRKNGLTDAQWQAVMIEMLREMKPEPPSRDELERLQKQVAQMNASLLPKAKAHLKSSGMSDAEVEAVPPAQAVATYAVAEMERWRDERERWFGLPFWQGFPGLLETDRTIQATQKSDPNPLVSMEPGTAGWAKQLVKPDRKSAALQTIEAVRAHAAGNGGKLPAKLADVALPLPIDPATGQPMTYEPREGGFTLISRIPQGEPADELRYEVTLQK